MAEIRITQKSGFCFGVKRAVDMIEESLNSGCKRIYCLGELIHNPDFTKSLADRGVRFITPEEIDSLPDDALLFIRTHGTTEQVFKNLESRGTSYSDATCPYVKKLRGIVASQDESVLVMMIGDAKHPEVEGVMSCVKGIGRVFASSSELKAFLAGDARQKKSILVVQTTYDRRDWSECVDFVGANCPECTVFDTICRVTADRQSELMHVAAESDLTVVVGGKHSSNTAKLTSIAKAVCPLSFHIENASELDALAPVIKGATKIAIAAGASTPGGIIQEVYNKMADIVKEEISFAEMLDQTFRTLNTGERATGIVLAVNPAEIKVDLGTKHTGILPYDEVTAESGVDLNDLYKVGDEIEVICGKFSDADGTVLLSRKKIDAQKYWEGIKAAGESGEMLSGTIKEIVKNDNGYAGVIVMYGPNKVFIPASQTGIPKGEELDSLKGQNVEFRIIDVNEQRKRAVGSIKSSSKASRKAAEDEFFATAQVGDKFEGKVRAIVNYGAFVNLGPVDGMVHISELSWGRLKKPSEVLTEGQIINVYIKAIDVEKRRISLGYKTEENDPWNIFAKNYKIGDVVDATIVSLMPFGAFAEIFPDFDGLIHISQISNKPIPNPASVLKVGDKVTVKITAADFERRRLSLSIRALLEDDASAEEAAEEVAEAPAEEAAEAPAEEAAE